MKQEIVSEVESNPKCAVTVRTDDGPIIIIATNLRVDGMKTAEDWINHFSDDQKCYPLRS